jgi:WD40 repeat protein
VEWNGQEVYCFDVQYLFSSWPLALQPVMLKAVQKIQLSTTIRSVAFSKGGKRIAIGGENSQLVVFNLKEKGKREIVYSSNSKASRIIPTENRITSLLFQKENHLSFTTISNDNPCGVIYQLNLKKKKGETVYLRNAPSWHFLHGMMNNNSYIISNTNQILSVSFDGKQKRIEKQFTWWPIHLSHIQVFEKFIIFRDGSIFYFKRIF